MAFGSTFGLPLRAAVLTLALQAATIGSTPAGSAAPPPSTDLNGDGFVDVADFNIFRREFLQLAPCCNGTYNADFNCDTKVDVLDFNIFRQSFIPGTVFDFSCAP